VSFAVLRALVVASWRERLLRPLFGGLCLLFCFTEISAARFSHELQDPTLLLTLLIGAGSVGKDVSSGVLPLLFTRPLVRSRYVLAKWLAVGSAVSILTTLTFLVQELFLSRAGFGVPRAEVAAAVFQSVTHAFGMSSVLVILSVLVSGMTDALLWIGLSTLPMLVQKYLSQRVAEEWQAFLDPSLDWSATFGPPVDWFRLLSYLSTVTLCLALASLAINRKELSYASG
jgi:ABC-type transport system involved in multi-copper enzyme maturation permease subunit